MQRARSPQREIVSLGSLERGAEELLGLVEIVHAGAAAEEHERGARRLVFVVLVGKLKRSSRVGHGGVLLVLAQRDLARKTFGPRREQVIRLGAEQALRGLDVRTSEGPVGCAR